MTHGQPFFSSDKKKLAVTAVTMMVVVVAAVVAVALTKGYTFSSKEKRVVGTGIISVSSIPDGASVYLDGHLTTATNTTVSSLQPKSYAVRIVKEGFIPWEKSIEVKEGLVSEVKATLFPSIPTIYPLTYNGVLSPVLSPDGLKLAFVVPLSPDHPARQKGGIWVWSFSLQPISFARSGEPHQIVASTSSLDFAKARLRWSPDSKQLLATLQEGGMEGSSYERNFLLSPDQLTNLADLRDITPQIAASLKAWDEDQQGRENIRILAITDLKVRKIASDSGSLKWSPDESKFITSSMLLKEKKGGADNLIKDAKVYDLSLAKLGEKPVYQQAVSKLGSSAYKEYNLPAARDYIWLPNSRHIILVEKERISIAEFDGSNVAVIYAGAFEEGQIFPWPDSSKLSIVTSFNTPTASQPNLFGINLK